MKNIFFPIPICMAALMLLGCLTNPTASPPDSEPVVSTETSKPDNIISKLVIGNLPSGLTLETLPTRFVTITENVVMEPAWVEYVIEPTEYEWVEGDIKGFTTQHLDTSPSIETVSEKYLYQEPSTELVVVSPLEAENGYSAQPTLVVERLVPGIYKSMDRKLIKGGGPSVTRTVPYEYKNGKTRVPISKPKWIEKVHPAVLKQIEIRKVAQLPSFIIRDEMGQVVNRFDKGEDLVAFVKSGKTP